MLTKACFLRHNLHCKARSCCGLHLPGTVMLQIKLLRVLGHLGASDKQASDNMYAVVADSMRRGNTGHTIGNAIVYEAVRTIANIYPSPALLQSGSLPNCHSNSSSKATCSLWQFLTCQAASFVCAGSCIKSISLKCDLALAGYTAVPIINVMRRTT